MFPQLAGFARAHGSRRAFCLDTRDGRLSNYGKSELIRAIVRTSNPALIVAGGEWTDGLAYVAGEQSRKGRVLSCSGVTAITRDPEGFFSLSLPAYEGRLVRRHAMAAGPAFITVSPGGAFPDARRSDDFRAALVDLPMSADWIIPLPHIAPPSLSQAQVIIDLGYGIRDRSGYDLAGELKRSLEGLGLEPMFGATRKVTQDLKLLPLDAQIGQTGVRVNPEVVIALGVSGAPQHVDYIGSRAEILCFNKDPDAPLMKLNATRPAPRVHPIIGDLFVTVQELAAQLREG